MVGINRPFEMYDCSNSLWTSSELCRLFNAQVLHFLRLTSSMEEVYLKTEIEFEVEILLRVSRSCSTETDFIYMQLDPPLQLTSLSHHLSHRKTANLEPGPRFWDSSTFVDGKRERLAKKTEFLGSLKWTPKESVEIPWWWCRRGFGWDRLRILRILDGPKGSVEIPWCGQSTMKLPRFEPTSLSPPNTEDIERRDDDDDDDVVPKS